MHPHAPPRRSVHAVVCAALAWCAVLGSCSQQDLPSELARIRRWEDGRVLAGDSLAVLLRGAAPPIRAAAARALGRIGDPRALDPLVAALESDAQADVRAEAAFALGILGAPEAVPALGRATTREVDARALGEVLLALGRLQQPGTAEVIVPLLGNAHPHVREQAVEALAQLADTTTVEPLLAAMQDPIESVAWRAVYALEKVPTARAIAPLAQLAQSPSPLIRAYVARTLGRIGDPAGARTVIGLLTAARDEWRVRVNAAGALGRIASPEAVRALASAYPDSVFHVRTAVLAGLELAAGKPVTSGNAKQRAALAALVRPVLQQACSDSVVDVRAAAYSALAVWEKGAAYALLLQGVDDRSAHVAAICGEAMGRCGEPRGRAVLLGLLADSTRPRMQAAAAGGLGQLHDLSAAPAIRQHLFDRDWVLATTCVEVLGTLGDRSSVPQLVEAYQKRQEPGRRDVRWQVVQTLEALKDSSAVPLLRAALADDDPRVRVSARKALLAVLPEAQAASLPTELALRQAVRPTQRSALQPPRVVRSRARQLVLETGGGRVVIELLPDEAPQTVESFARLAERHVFDGLTFHRVVPNFVVQGGDPMGNGWGDAGYTLRCEYSPLRYDAGVVGVAHSGKDTGGCQLFITQSPQPHLDARYTIFGRVIQGMAAVDRIQIGDRFTAKVVWEEGTN